MTTVDMNLETLGRLAAQRLFQAMERRHTGGAEQLPCRLVIRGSTAAGA